MRRRDFIRRARKHSEVPLAGPAQQAEACGTAKRSCNRSCRAPTCLLELVHLSRGNIPLYGAYVFGRACNRTRAFDGER
jgi:hypothetical protein